MAESGYTESPENSNCNKFAVEAHLKNCTYWCAAYTSALLLRLKVSGVPAGALTLSTRANMAAWKAAGKWVRPEDIQAGDVVFEHVSDRNGADHNVPSHTEFATAPFKNSKLPTVGGNTSSGSSGSQDNGGGVFPRSRPLSVVIGAGRPTYTIAASPPDPEDEDMKPITYKVSIDPGNSQTAPGDLGIWVTTDRVTTELLTQPALVHGIGLGWYPKDPIFVPKPMHDWMLENSTSL